MASLRPADLNIEMCSESEFGKFDKYPSSFIQIVVVKLRANELAMMFPWHKLPDTQLGLFCNLLISVGTQLLY